MIPKLRACADAVEQGVGFAHIIDGRVHHSLLIELLTDMGVGTMVTREKASEAPARDPRPDARTSCARSSGCRAAAPRILAGEGVALYFEKPSARTRNSMEMAAASSASPGLYAAGRARHRHARERRGRDPDARLLSPDHRRAGVRPWFARADGGAERRAGAQHAVGHRPSAPGARRLEDHRAAVRADRWRRRSPSSARQQQCRSLARRGLRTCSAPSSRSPPGRLPARGCAAGSSDRRPGRGGRPAPTSSIPMPGCRWAGRKRGAPRRVRALPGERSADGAMRPNAWFMHCLPAHRGEEVTAPRDRRSALGGLAPGRPTGCIPRAARCCGCCNIPIEEE